MKTVKRELEPLSLRADFSPDTLNVEKRTVDFVFSTGARGTQWQHDIGLFYEELEVSEGSVDLSRLNNGAPFMLMHDKYDIDAVIGKIERAWIQDGKLMGTVRFGVDENSDKYFKKVQDGILTKVSVGYKVHRYALVEEKEGDYPVYRAMSWTPFEGSLVTIAFDDNAQARSEKNEKVKTFKCEFEIRNNDFKGETMPKVEETKPAPTPTVDVEAERIAAANEAVEAERTRILSIRSEVRKAKLPEEFADELIEKKFDLEKARGLIIDKFAEAEPTPIDNKTRIDFGDQDELKTRREGIEQALLNRADGSKYTIDEKGKKFSNMSLLRLCEEIVPNAHRYTRLELAERALATSDLGDITANVMKKRLSDGYEAWNRTFDPFVSYDDHPDFKEVDIDKFGGLSSLKEVPEGGEYEEGSVKDEKESYKLSKYGRLISFTEEMIINDDMKALNKIPRLAGQAAARLEGVLVYGQLTSNPKMGDGTVLFHADHGNLANATAINEAGLSAMLKLGREQKFGEEKLNVEFKFLVCGTAKEVEALKMLNATIVATKSADTNIFKGRYIPIFDPNVPGNKWYMIGDPNIHETIEVGYLQGTGRRPVLTSKEDFKTGGLTYKVRHIVKAKAADWRAMAYNPGA